MATIRKRNGKFQVQVRLKASPSFTRTFATKTEAVRWARDMEGGSINGSDPAATKKNCKLTFGELLERYYKDISSHRIWHRRERVIVDNYRKSPLFHTQMGQLSEAAIAKYRDDRLRVVKPATVVREIALASHCITVAQREWGVEVPANGFKMVRKPKIRNSRERRLSVEEWKALVEADSALQNRSILHIIEFAIETAMRKGELLRARWTDVNIRLSTLHIPVTKNGYPRTIPLTPRALEILSSIEKKAASSTIFSVKYNTLATRWEDLVRVAGIRDCRWHDLRHEGISRHFERGLSIPEVALISGHRDYQMLRRYTHIRPENVAAKLAQLSARTE